MNQQEADHAIVIERVEGRSMTAWPFEVGIIARDGQITDIFKESKRDIPRDNFLRIGSKSETRAFRAYTRPFNLTFWLRDPDDFSEPDEGITLDMPVLTRDGQIVTGRIDLDFSVVEDHNDADRLLLLIGRRDRITKHDVADTIKNELLAKVLALDLGTHTAADLRGNETLLRRIDETLRRELVSTISGYGLRLVNFYVNWGLTPDEHEQIKQQKHTSQIRDIERERELREKLDYPVAMPIQPSRSETPPQQRELREKLDHPVAMPVQPSRPETPPQQLTVRMDLIREPPPRLEMKDTLDRFFGLEASPNTGQQISDRSVLVALYNATDGPNWKINSNWLTDAPIDEWYGVSTDGNDHVDDLDLSNNKLSGKIPSELARLDNLETLDLENNQLSGEIPSELARLDNLETLDLSDNRLSGEIPPELGGLDNLETLDLSGNLLSG